MKTIEKASAQLKYWYARYLRSTDTHLYQVYKNCSYAKQSAYEHCKYRLVHTEGVVDVGDWRIIGHNCNNFTCATVYTTTDNKRVFRVETYANTFECLV